MSEEKHDSENPPQPSKPEPVSITGAAECPVVYANFGNVIQTPFDIQIVFADLVQSGPTTMAAKANVRVIMAPEHAALLGEGLIRRTEAYSQMHGKLRPIGKLIGPAPEQKA
jgi:Protein of unknown function (DUF3467)